LWPELTTSDKVFVLLQARFANVHMGDEQNKIENASMLHILRGVTQQAPRIAKGGRDVQIELTAAILNIMCVRRAGQGSRSALELLHTINGKAWEDHAAVLAQVPRMGPQSIRVLAHHGVNTWEHLINLSSSQLEAWVCRKPPYGQDILKLVRALPRYQISVA
jgi:ATP-dependent DNA helicase HFM1/MER3